MLKKIATVLVGFVAVAGIWEDAFAQELPRAFIPDSEVRSLRSSYGRRAEYQISVALPFGYEQSGKAYPVLYVLDANGQFGTVAEAARALAQFDKSIPHLIIVGIGYPVGAYWNSIPHRTLDYTPTEDLAWEANIAENYLKPLGSGGSPEFRTFVSDQLLPFIDDEYRTLSNDRGLYGFSLGGLFVVDTLLRHPGLFQRYIAGSPAVFWDDEVVFNYEENYAHENTNLRARLFVSVGTDEPPFLYQSIVKLIDVLEHRKYEELGWSKHIFEGETHDSVIPATISRGLRAIYDPPTVDTESN